MGDPPPYGLRGNALFASDWETDERSEMVPPVIRQNNFRLLACRLRQGICGDLAVVTKFFLFLWNRYMLNYCVFVVFKMMLTM